MDDDGSIWHPIWEWKHGVMPGNEDNFVSWEPSIPGFVTTWPGDPRYDDQSGAEKCSCCVP